MRKSRIAAALLLAMSATAMSAAKADVIPTNVTFYFSNAGFYQGAPLKDQDTFATATLHYVDANTVQLTMAALQGLDPNFYVNDWGFNLASGFTVSSMPTYMSGTEVKTTGNGSKTNYDISYTGTTPFGAQTYTLAFGFDTSSPGQLQFPSTSVYNIVGTGLGTNLATDFTSAAVHVQGGTISSFFNGSTTDGSGGGSGNPVPEPTTVAALGLGMLALAAARRRKSK